MPHRTLELPFVHYGTADYRLVRSSFEGGVGFVVERNEDNQRLRWERMRGQDGLWAFPVAGTSYRKAALSVGDFSPGSPLLLIPDPENEYDPNAIGVWDHTRTHHIGFVPADLLDYIGPIVRDGGPFGCIVLWEYRDGGRRVGVRALLATDDVRVGVPGRKRTAHATSKPASDPGAGFLNAGLPLLLLAGFLVFLIATC